MDYLYQLARDRVMAGRTCVLTVILESSGSTPRGCGASMLVDEAGLITGTIGGGAMEGLAIEKAQAAAVTGQHETFSFDLHGTSALTSDFICGGSGTVFLYAFTYRDLPVLNELCHQLSNGLASFLLLRADESGTPRSYCVTDSWEVISGEELAPFTEKLLVGMCKAPGVHDDPALIWQEKVAPENTVYLMGGGHVAQSLAQAAELAGFRTVVVDDREEFANPARFPASRCIVCAEYDELLLEDITPADYIVVVTRGHKADRIALDWALKTRACYIGMIGSIPKRDLIYNELRRQGVPQSRLDEVYSPIGIKLGGRTPGEIAISIAAELISVRSRLAKAAGTHEHSKRA